jgi:hypothetical protein
LGVDFVTHFITTLQHEEKKKQILENTYLNLSKSGAYVGPDKLHRVLKSKGIAQIGKHKGESR